MDSRVFSRFRFLRFLPALLLPAFLLPAAPATAQQDTVGAWLQGVVRDELTLLPVSQGEVRLFDREGQTVQATQSDVEGRFSLRMPGLGPYHLQVERIGYQTKESGEFSIPPGQILSVEVHLAPAPLPLDSVQVFGRARPLRATEQLIQGRLRDFESGEPIPQGTVSLLKAFGPGEGDVDLVERVISDDRGLFALITPLPATYRLRGERIGYRTSISPDLHMMPGDTVLLDLYMSVEAIIMDPITVRASARPWENRYNLLGMDSFFHRQSRFGDSGFGTFLTRDSLARHDGQVTTGFMLLSTAMEVRAVNLEGGVVLRGECNPRYYLDGVEIVRGDPVHRPMGGAQASTPTSQGFNPELTYPPEALEGIEVYVSPSIPAEFSQGYPCGVVALWTRRR